MSLNESPHENFLRTPLEPYVVQVCKTFETETRKNGSQDESRDRDQVSETPSLVIHLKLC